MAPTTDPEIRLIELEAGLAAANLLMRHLLAQLAEASPAIRLGLEQLLGEIRVTFSEAEVASSDEEGLRLMTLAKVEQRLGELSELLNAPLVPRATLHEIPPQS